jgi:ABC-type lipoprotein export system ATPase subunit
MNLLGCLDVPSSGGYTLAGEEITGLNESQVKVYIYRARVALKAYIGKMENVI